MTAETVVFTCVTQNALFVLQQTNDWLGAVRRYGGIRRGDARLQADPCGSPGQILVRAGDTRFCCDTCSDRFQCPSPM